MMERDIDIESLICSSIADDYKEIIENLEEESNTLCVQLQERLTTLIASVKTLKENVDKEKELWKTELKETIDLEKKFSKHNCHHSCWAHGDRNYQMELNTNEVLKSHAMKTAQIQKEIDSTIYKQKLLEAENMCNLELTKIKNSLDCLAPLQSIMKEWNADTAEPQITERISLNSEPQSSKVDVTTENSSYLENPYVEFNVNQNGE